MDDKGTPASSSSNQDTLQEDDQGYLVPNNLGGQADDHIYDEIPANSGAQDDDHIYENIYDEIPANSGGQADDHIYDEIPANSGAQDDDHIYENIYDEIPANLGPQENDNLYDDVILPHIVEHTYANVTHYDHIELMEPVQEIQDNVHISTETLKQDNSDLPGTSLSFTCISSHRSKSPVNQR